MNGDHKWMKHVEDGGPTCTSPDCAGDECTPEEVAAIHACAAAGTEQVDCEAEPGCIYTVEPGETFPGTADARTFPAPLDKTLDVCAETCQDYAYMGLQWEADCFCSNEYDLRGEADPHDCGIYEGHPNPRCATDEWTGWDDATHFEGCAFRNAVFEVFTSTYIGCFVDGGEEDPVIQGMTDEMRVHSGRECEVDEKHGTCVPAKPTCSQECDWGICHEIAQEEKRLRRDAEASFDEASLAAMDPLAMSMPTYVQVNWRPCGQCHDECYCSGQEFSHTQETCARDSANRCEWKETDVSCATVCIDFAAVRLRRSSRCYCVVL